jgi:hypothetical protein
MTRRTATNSACRSAPYGAFEGIRHRQLDVDVPGRDRPLEPARIECLEFAGAHQLGKRRIDQCLELPIVLSQHQCIRIGWISFVEQHEIRRIFRIRPEAGDQDIVFHPCAGAAGLDQQEGFGVILALHDGHPKLLLIVHLVDEQRRVGAGGHGDGLAAQIVRALDVPVGTGDPFELRNEERVGKSDLLLSTAHIGGRSALDVDRAVGDQRDAGGRRHRVVLDVETSQTELRLHRLHDMLA